MSMDYLVGFILLLYIRKNADNWVIVGPVMRLESLENALG